MKIAGVSLWIWMMGVVITIGSIVVVMNHRATHSLEAVPLKAEAALDAAKKAVKAEFDVGRSEGSLNHAPDAGRAQLLAAKMQEAKSSADARKAEFNRLLDDLITTENVAGCSGKYSVPIRSFFDKGTSLTKTMMERANNWNGGDPYLRGANDKYEEICNADLSDVISGRLEIPVIPPP